MKKIFAFAALFATLSFAFSCSKDDSNDKKDNKGNEEEQQEEEYVCPITIDGDFADWDNLDTSKYAVASAKNSNDSNWEAVKTIRCYADETAVYYYIQFDKAEIDEVMTTVTGDAGLPIRLNINTDGEFTSGYLKYSLQGYDFIVEGSLAADGAWTAFDGTLHQRFDDWVALLEPGHGLVTGAGKDNLYEIVLFKEIFNAAAASSTDPKPMGDTFQTGIRFYTPDWSELSNMPNSTPDPDSENEGIQKGWGNLLEVVTNK